MKNVFKTLVALVATGALVAGCAKTTGNNDKKDGGAGLVTFEIKTEVPATRNASGTQGATSGESTIKVSSYENLDVAVFSLSGEYETGGSLKLTDDPANAGVYTTENAAPLEVEAGKHIFFVFANNTATTGGASKITMPTAGTNLSTWMHNEFNVEFTGDLPTTIATDSEFLLGTLWKAEVNAPQEGTETNPTQVSLTIGRLASKITLKSAVKGTGSSVAGTFTLPNFRIGTVAKSMHNGGVIDPVTTFEPNAPGVLVVSAKHNAPYLLGGTAGFNTTDFRANTDYSFKAATGTGTETDPYNFFYATENTTSLQAGGAGNAQYYGNTTYIQLRTVYTPDASEVHNADGTDANAVLATPTFWLGDIPTASEYNVLFNAEPNARTTSGKAVTNVRKYENGINYHHFAVSDPLETGGVYKNRVLRNHYYEYAVTTIKNIGSHTEVVEPTDPVLDNTMIEFVVNVKPWDKVANDNITVR